MPVPKLSLGGTSTSGSGSGSATPPPRITLGLGLDLAITNSRGVSSQHQPQEESPRQQQQHQPLGLGLDLSITNSRGGQPPPPQQQQQQQQTSLSVRPSTSYKSKPPSAADQKRQRQRLDNDFCLAFDRNELPVKLVPSACGMGMDLIWTADVRSLDMHHFLPLFFSGMEIQEDPYRFAATTGFFELLEVGAHADVAPVLPLLLKPMKRMLNRRDPAVVWDLLRVVQEIVDSGLGHGLLMKEGSKQGGFRSLLPLFVLRGRRGGGGGGAYKRGGVSLEDMVQETLEMVEAWAEMDNKVEGLDLKRIVGGSWEGVWGSGASTTSSTTTSSSSGGGSGSGSRPGGGGGAMRKGRGGVGFEF